MILQSAYEDKYNEILRILSNNSLSLEEKFDRLRLPELVQNSDIYQAELLAQNQELIHKEKELIEAREEFQEIYELAPIAYFEVSKYWKIIKHNQFALKTFLNQKIDTFKYKPFSLLIHPSSAIAYSEMIKALEYSASVHTNLEFFHQERFIGRVDVSKHNDNYLVAITEITSEIILKESLKKYNEELESEVIKRTNKLNDFIAANTAFSWEVDQDGIYRFVSDNVTNILGYEPNEMIGKTPFDFMDEDDKKSVFNDFISIVLQKKHIENLHNWNITKNNEKVCLLTNGVPFFDIDGKYLGYRGTDLNVTSEAYKTLLIEQQKIEFETIFNYSKDGIAIMDLESHFLDCNDAYEKMSGFSKEELLKKSCLELTIQEDKQKSIDAIEYLKEFGSIESFEKSCQLKDGKIIVVNMSLSLMPDKKRIITVTKNITQNKLIEKQAKLASMGELISNIAHQWRQPLTVISSLASGIALKKEYKVLEDSDLLETMENIVQETQNLSNTIDSFKKFIDSTETRKDISVYRLINKIVSIVGPNLNNHFIEYNVEVDQSIFINGFENELIQAIINIINNAKDAIIANIKEKEPRYIFIRGVKNGDICELTITDNGKGILVEDINKIFEPYFTTKHQSLGTGLGLTMSYQIITELHEGSLYAVNTTYLHKGKEHAGASFQIQLDTI